MRTVVRVTEHLDPIWALRTEHVHFVLSAVLDYWADELGTFPITLPPPSPSKVDDRAAVLEEARQHRLESLGSIAASGPMAAAEDLATSGVPLLYASVLWRAVRDWADGCWSPFAVDQRSALQAYWWIMGLPYTSTKGMDLGDWRKVALGKRRRFKVPADQINPLPLIGLSVSSLFTERKKDPPLPPFFRCEEEEPITFLTCCSVLGLNPTPMRRFIHTVPPD